MMAKFIEQYLLPRHEWACFGIVGGLVAAIGCPLIYWGLKQVNEVHLSLPQTAQTLHEDVRAVSDAGPRGRSSADTLLNR